MVYEELPACTIALFGRNRSWNEIESTLFTFATSFCEWIFSLCPLYTELSEQTNLPAPPVPARRHHRQHAHAFSITTSRKDPAEAKDPYKDPFENDLFAESWPDDIDPAEFYDRSPPPRPRVIPFNKTLPDLPERVKGGGMSTAQEDAIMELVSLGYSQSGVVRAMAVAGNDYLLAKSILKEFGS